MIHRVGRRAPAVLLVPGVVLLAACGRQVAVPAPDVDSPACQTVMLPDVVSGAGARPTLLPGTSAWGEPPITWRCGVSRPGGLTPTAQLVEVNGIGWLPVEGAGGTGFYATTWPSSESPVYIEVLVPEAYPAPADVLDHIRSAGVTVVTKKSTRAKPSHPKASKAAMARRRISSSTSRGRSAGTMSSAASSMYFASKS